MITAVLYLAVVICLTAAGQVMIKYGITKRGAGNQKLVPTMADPRILTGCAMIFLATVFNLYAYKILQAKVSPVAGACTLILVFLLSALFLGEKISTRRWGGLFLIVLGILIFFIKP